MNPFQPQTTLKRDISQLHEPAKEPLAIAILQLLRTRGIAEELLHDTITAVLALIILGGTEEGTLDDIQN